jgi:hypothetical protein
MSYDWHLEPTEQEMKDFLASVVLNARDDFEGGCITNADYIRSELAAQDVRKLESVVRRSPCRAQTGTTRESSTSDCSTCDGVTVGGWVISTRQTQRYRQTDRQTHTHTHARAHAHTHTQHTDTDTDTHTHTYTYTHMVYH